ncbi:hypothetical protein EUTSA_v10013917mg [Eutrema salsugineum]|uniref:RING-Gid-type domain-containing protein n=1 Tax=Eutrema salsugineum TaxID=72664 RepID=V4KSH5_EUTSA|nr:protein RMD5 homolog [Eutrema salsugineum]ESQ40895.1 hypothetical protein EUTSA_v10013917mg [Eutrema salsugineum]
MSLIGTVKDAFDTVTKRQKLYHSVSQVVADRVCEGVVETLIRILLNNNDGLVEPQSFFNELRLKLDSLSPVIQLQGSQKETNTSLGKFEKVLDKSHHPDISRACKSIDFDTHLMNKMLVHYFYRQGLFQVGDCLVKEAGVEVEADARSQYLEIHRLTESLKLGNIEPAMRWISANREKLKQKGSELELKLTSLKYCEMLREGNSDDALKYARTHFPQFAGMVSSVCWDKMAKELTKQYYHLLDQPSNSPLGVALSAGLESLPTLLKMIHVMGLKKEEWEAMKEVPVDLKLGDEFQFHSVFVCPVSREQSSEENPPMMMPCRHVLCKQSIMRLTNNCRSRRFKCPYCPAQTSAAACRRLYF